ncbi:uncharacterized protein [Hyperolius riggenbachi]|uniref:uncharacterized protein n=1 Tax=Hyperolius riggenbachi TaxID=752182 RepID=UPI0035A33A63
MISTEQAAACFYVLYQHEQKKRKEGTSQSQKPAKRRLWAKDWLLDRDNISHDNLLRELRVSAPEDYRNYLRMSDTVFQRLLGIVRPYTQKEDTCMRKAITAEQRLMATLHCLATGRRLQDLKFSTGISPQGLGLIIPETCAAIVECLKDDYMKLPNSPEGWMAIARDFKELWKFPNCGGAVDGKHIRLVAPPDSGSMYYNYKGFYSVVLMALVNARYEFVMVDIGALGRMSDGGVIDNTSFYRKLGAKELGLPSNAETEFGLNFVFVGDEAFALHENLLKPFPQKGLDYPHKVYNFRLSYARRVVENAFGILANRFRVLHTAINLHLDKVDVVVYACCMLHNFLRREQGSAYLPNNSVDTVDAAMGAVVPEPSWYTAHWRYVRYDV